MTRKNELWSARGGEFYPPLSCWPRHPHGNLIPNLKASGECPIFIAKSHVLLSMQFSYPCVVWNNIPKFHENCASSFWAMKQSMCVIVVSPKVEDTTLRVGEHKLDCYHKHCYKLDRRGRAGGVIRSDKWENHKNQYPC